LTKPIHPRVIGPDGKPKRTRRTKHEIAEAAADAAFAKLWAEAQAIAQERLASTSASQKRRAERLLRKWHS
jgi:hypothetical protein